MKYLLTILLTLLMMSCTSTSEKKPYDYGKMAGATYIITQDDLDENKLTALKKAWDILNIVVDKDIPSDLSVQGYMNKLISESDQKYAPLIHAFIIPEINKLNLNFNFSNLEKPKQLNILKEFRDGVRSVIMDNIEKLKPEHHNGLRRESDETPSRR